MVWYMAAFPCALGWTLLYVDDLYSLLEGYHFITAYARGPSLYNGIRGLSSYNGMRKLSSSRGGLSLYNGIRGLSFYKRMRELLSSRGGGIYSGVSNTYAN
ncbi:hypothetical protein EDD85DRAFT_338315 [Armillaria nabsnona]|nr:hypothetical protein EDD85DRAFT_338315 [Armillaria nabsnona]